MISVIVPIYNVEKYLRQCIESLLHQTNRDLEIILIDDGSPDRCGEICDEYALRDNRIKVIHQQNRGAAAARNTGLRIAKGKYITFVDPDDWIKPEMLESLRNAIESTGKDLAICLFEHYAEDGSLINKSNLPAGKQKVLSQKELILRCADIGGLFNFSAWAKLYRSANLRGLCFPENLFYSEDIRFFFDYLLKIHSAVVVQQVFYCYRKRAGSITHGGIKVESIADSYKTYEYIYDEVKQDIELRHHFQACMLDGFLYRYRVAKKIYESLEESEKGSVKPAIRAMRGCIRKYAAKALLNPEIYWKTRLYYLLVY